MARIKWEAPKKELFESVAERAQLLVLYFGDRADTNDVLNEVDLANHVTAKTVVCVRVPKPQEAESPEAPVTDDAIAAKALWERYGIEAEDTFVIADRYGNAAFKTQERALAGKLREVSSHFRGVRKQLRQETAAAKAALENGDKRAAIEASLRGKALGLTGYEEAMEAGKLHDELMQQGLKELKAAGKDAAKLDALVKLYAGTELEQEIAKARTVEG